MCDVLMGVVCVCDGVIVVVCMCEGEGVIVVCMIRCERQSKTMRGSNSHQFTTINTRF